jgi:hypothetical protein
MAMSLVYDLFLVKVVREVAGPLITPGNNSTGQSLKRSFLTSARKAVRTPMRTIGSTPLGEVQELTKHPFRHTRFAAFQRPDACSLFPRQRFFCAIYGPAAVILTQ